MNKGIMKTNQMALRSLDLLLKLLLFMGVYVAATVHAQANLDWEINLQGNVEMLAEQADGKILVGGGTNFLSRLNPDGSLDASFRAAIPFPSVNPRLDCLLVQSDQKILLAGFIPFGTNLFRLHQDGRLDPSFNLDIRTFSSIGVSPSIRCLALQPDGKILAGGSYPQIAYSHLVRLHADGSLDNSFLTLADGPIDSLLLQPDGKILVSGYATNATFLYRLNADGRRDPDFHAEIEYSPKSILLQGDGKILLGSMILKNEVWPVVRLNADGSLDISFVPGVDRYTSIYVRAQQADGRIIIDAGRDGIFRLNPDGSLNAIFDAGSYDAIDNLILTTDGDLLVTGRINGQQQSRIRRLRNNVPATQRLSFDGATLTWMRGGSSPEIWGASFEATTNGLDWISLGIGERVPGGWQRSGIHLAAGSTVRALGYITGVSGSSRLKWVNYSWVMETTTTNSLLSPLKTASANLAHNQAKFGLQLNGLQGQKLVIEGSTDLIRWLPIWTNHLGQAQVQFTDPDSTSMPIRFYRSALPR